MQPDRTNRLRIHRTPLSQRGTACWIDRLESGLSNSMLHEIIGSKRYAKAIKTLDYKPSKTMTNKFATFMVKFYFHYCIVIFLIDAINPHLQ